MTKLKSPFEDDQHSARWQAGVTRHSHLYLPTLDGVPQPLAVAADTIGWVDVYVMEGLRVVRDAFDRPKVQRLFGRVKLIRSPEFSRPRAASKSEHGEGLPASRLPRHAPAHAGRGPKSQMPLRARDRSLPRSSGRRALAGDSRTRGAVYGPAARFFL